MRKHECSGLSLTAPQGLQTCRTIDYPHSPSNATFPFSPCILPTGTAFVLGVSSVPWPLPALISAFQQKVPCVPKRSWWTPSLGCGKANLIFLTVLRNCTKMCALFSPPRLEIHLTGEENFWPQGKRLIDTYTHKHIYTNTHAYVHMPTTYSYICLHVYTHTHTYTYKCVFNLMTEKLVSDYQFNIPILRF